MKLKLTNVTLLGIDCVNIDRLQEAMNVCEKDIEFGAVRLLSSLPTDDSRLVKIPHIGSTQEYSRFCIEELCKYVDTEHVLLIQYDGFILNPQNWIHEFLKYDYIGAPWLVADWSVKNFDFPKELQGTSVVGNGGFSLRSKKFLKVCAKLALEGKLPKLHPEDVALCVWYRDVVEKEGILFAPPDLAAKFSIEGDDDIYHTQFGFHGFSWTDIDDWIGAHPEYGLITETYRKQRSEHLARVEARKVKEVK